jgi:hypothetical protein
LLSCGCRHHRWDTVHSEDYKRQKHGMFLGLRFGDGDTPLSCDDVPAARQARSTNRLQHPNQVAKPSIMACGQPRGAVAQMGERCNRTAEVRGSIPLGSTTRKLLK